MTQTVSTKLTGPLAEKIDQLVESGLYVSRSEALRDAARLLVMEQKGSLKGLGKEQLTEEDKARFFRKYVKEKGWEHLL